MKKATAIKDKYIRDKVDESLKLMSDGETENPRTALHSVLLREREVAAKESRKPAYYSRAIADEFFGFMLAGHDTSATAIAWGVKYLADHPAVQTRLRAELARGAARSDQGEEDADVRRAVEGACSLSGCRRRGGAATREHDCVCGATDADGHDGAGTHGSQRDGRVLDGERRRVPETKDQRQRQGEGVREPGRARARRLRGLWDDDDIEAFKPERWLKKGEDGAEVFDPAAGPQLSFGLGPRQCFGKEVCAVRPEDPVALINWHFDLLDIPEELGGYEAVQKFAPGPTKCLSGWGRRRFGEW